MTGERGPKGDHGQTGEAGPRGKEAPRRALIGYLLLTAGVILGFYFTYGNSKDNKHLALEAKTEVIQRVKSDCETRKDFAFSQNALLDPLLDSAQKNLRDLPPDSKKKYYQLRQIQKDTLLPAIRTNC